MCIYIFSEVIIILQRAHVELVSATTTKHLHGHGQQAVEAKIVEEYSSHTPLEAINRNTLFFGGGSLCIDRVM